MKGKKKSISCVITEVIDCTGRPTERMAHTLPGQIYQWTSQRRSHRCRVERWVGLHRLWGRDGGLQGREQLVKSPLWRHSKPCFVTCRQLRLGKIVVAEQSPEAKSHSIKPLTPMATTLPVKTALARLPCLSNPQEGPIYPQRENTHVCVYLVPENKGLTWSVGELSQGI